MFQEAVRKAIDDGWNTLTIKLKIKQADNNTEESVTINLKEPLSKETLDQIIALVIKCYRQALVYRISEVTDKQYPNTLPLSVRIMYDPNSEPIINSDDENRKEFNRSIETYDNYVSLIYYLH